MVRKYYNSRGALTGFSRSSAEDNRGTGLLLILGVILSPLYPLYFMVSSIYSFLTLYLHFHALLAFLGCTALFAAGLYLLWKSVTFRYVYLGGSTAVATYLVFTSSYASSDAVWASFYALLTLAFGSAITYAAGLIGPKTYHDEPHSISPRVEPAAFPEPNKALEQESIGLSYALSFDQAVELLDRIDDTTFNILQAVIENSPEPNLAGLPWGAVQDITGGKSWSQFARGTMARLHRELRDITGDPTAVLLLDSDKLKLSDEPTLDQGKVLLIHGSVVSTLKGLFSA